METNILGISFEGQNSSFISGERVDKLEYLSCLNHFSITLTTRIHVTTERAIGPFRQKNHELNKQLCSPVLDMFGLCHCSRDVQAHVPVLVPMQGRVFPPCRDPSFRAMYIDDSILASSIRLDKDCVPLIQTMAPYGRFDSCGFGIPGQWFSLEHCLRDIQRNVKSIGMIINTKKTTLMVFNNTKNRLCLPFCSLDDGDPLPIVRESRLLGIILDDKLSWWPLV